MESMNRLRGNFLLACAAIAFIVAGLGTAEAGLVTTGGSSWTGGGSGIDPMFTFTGDIGGNAFHGTLLADDLGGGIFHATSGSLVVDSGAAAGTYLLEAVGPATGGSLLGAFVGD